jgi:hypothetical protein
MEVLDDVFTMQPFIGSVGTSRMLQNKVGILCTNNTLLPRLRSNCLSISDIVTNIIRKSPWLDLKLMGHCRLGHVIISTPPGVIILHCLA